MTFYPGGKREEEDAALSGVLTSGLVDVAHLLSNHKSDLGRTMVTFQYRFSSKTLPFRGGNALSFKSWIVQVQWQQRQHGADYLHRIYSGGGWTKLWDLAFLCQGGCGDRQGEAAHLDSMDLGNFSKL